MLRRARRRTVDSEIPCWTSTRLDPTRPGSTTRHALVGRGAPPPGKQPRRGRRAAADRPRRSRSGQSPTKEGSASSTSGSAARGSAWASRTRDSSALGLQRSDGTSAFRRSPRSSLRSKRPPPTSHRRHQVAAGWPILPAAIRGAGGSRLVGHYPLTPELSGSGLPWRLTLVMKSPLGE